MSAGLVLSPPIGLLLQECGVTNAFFNPQTRTLTFCYELVEEIARRASFDFVRPPGLADRIAAGAFTFVFFHELGHALIYSLKLPITGREEDVADQIATYMALKSPDATTGIQAGSWFYSKNDVQFYTMRRFADEHSLSPQRQFNIVCWAYGKDPRLFAPLVKSVGLSAERASRCQGEYAQMSRSLELLLQDALYSGGTTVNSRIPSHPSSQGAYQIIRATSVFDQPSESAKKIGLIPAGTKVGVVSSTEDWLEIRSLRDNPPGFIRRDDAMLIEGAN